MSEELEKLEFDHFTVTKNASGKWDVLGRGGMGITYRAYDTKLRRTVALKVINPTLLDEDDAHKMFLREARAAANLNHRNVAQIYQVGTEEEKVYYAMEFIEGETLDKLVKRRQAEGYPGLDLKQALYICQQTVQALLAAETKKLVHRDIKPPNIMVTAEDDGAMLVKLIDFGLAKSLQTKGEHSVFVSQPGFMGTPTYASPEQITDRPLDIRADFYSLGATLWYMLEGKPPFTSDNPFELYNKHLKEPVPTQRLIDQDVPACVIELLDSMLQKDPDDRPQDARNLLEKIRVCINELGYSGQPDAGATQGPAGSRGAPPTMATQFAGTEDSEGVTRLASEASFSSVSPAKKSALPLVLTLVLALAAVGGGGAWWWLTQRDPGGSGEFDDPLKLGGTGEVPPVVPGASPAEITLKQADQLHEGQQWAPALSAYLKVKLQYAGSTEADAADKKINSMLEHALADTSPVRLAEYQPARADLNTLARSGSTPAAHLAGLLYREDDPQTARSLLSQARTTYNPAYDGIRMLDLDNTLARVTPDAAQRQAILDDIDAAIQDLLKQGKLDPASPAAERILSDAADNGSQQASMVLAEALTQRDEPRAFQRYKQSASKFESDGRWADAVSLYLKIRNELPSGRSYADLQLNRLFKTWADPKDTTIDAAAFTSLKPALEQAAEAGYAPAMLVLARHEKSDAALGWNKRAVDRFVSQKDWSAALDVLDALQQAGSEPATYANEQVTKLVAAFGPEGALLADTEFQAIRPQLEAIASHPNLTVASLLASRLAKTDVNESFRWTRLMASHSSATPAMQVQIASLYEQGIGTKKDVTEAVTWYQKAAEQHAATGKPAEALPALAAIYRLTRTGEAAFRAKQTIDRVVRSFADGAPGYTDAAFARAEPTLTEIAGLGDVEAMYLLGTRLAKSNPEKALHWLTRAAQGYVDEQYWPEAVEAYLLLAKNAPDRKTQVIAAMETFLKKLRPGININATDLAELAPPLEQAAELPVVAAMSLLSMYYKGHDDARATEWLTQAAEGNDSAAMIRLGLQFSNGHSVAQSYEQAFKWLERAHTLAHPDARVPLADCYLRGKGTPPDPQRAIQLLTQATDDGNALAMNMLGAYYSDEANGDTVDFARALKLFEQAAALDYGPAYGNLGIMHGAGNGVPANPAKAAEFWKKGIALDDVNSMFFYGSVVYAGEYQGIEKDEATGLRHIQDAAEAGLPAAQAWLKSKGLDAGN